MATLSVFIFGFFFVVTVNSSEPNKANNNNNTQAVNRIKQSLNFHSIKLRAEAFYLSLPATLREDAVLTTPELIKKYGYTAETYFVTTEDGYVLEMHRIPRGIKRQLRNAPVMLLQHGLLSSSADFVIAGPQKAMGYVLADAGYDVWIPNSRGNRYSRNHTRLNPESSEFWQFSWHEIAVYDLPAIIDYILAKTKHEKLYYVGHSQGTTVFYVLCSQKPEYNNKIHLQFSLAPVAYMSHLSSPAVRLLAPVSDTLIVANEFKLSSEWVQAETSNIFCNDDSVTQILCTNINFILMGYNPKQMNASLLPIIMGHTPAGAAFKQFTHYGQEINSGRFENFDYGPIVNLLLYGFVTPSQYDLSIVTAPVYLFYSRNDLMSHEIDVLQLCRELGNCKGKILISDIEFSHSDYMYGIYARDLVYNKLVDIANKHRM